MNAPKQISTTLKLSLLKYKQQKFKMHVGALVFNTECHLRVGNKWDKILREKLRGKLRGKLRKIWKFGQSKGQTEEYRTTFNRGGGWVFFGKPEAERTMTWYDRCPSAFPALKYMGVERLRSIPYAKMQGKPKITLKHNTRPDSEPMNLYKRSHWLMSVITRSSSRSRQWYDRCPSAFPALKYMGVERLRSIPYAKMIMWAQNVADIFFFETRSQSSQSHMSLTFRMWAHLLFDL